MRAPAPLLMTLLFVAALAPACTTMRNTVETVKTDTNPDSPVKETQTTGQKVGAAVTAPLHDVNLVRSKIPAILRQAAEAPYARPKPLNCTTLKAVIAPLDDALGADLDRPPPPKLSRAKQGQAQAGSATIDAIKSTEEGFIPFVSWMRLLSGAERYDRQVQHAILAGEVRRAYLKGLGLRMRCDPPAAPLTRALDVPPPKPDREQTVAADAAPRATTSRR